MSGDPAPRRERRNVPPSHAATTEFAAPGTDPNATAPDPPAAPDAPADDPGRTAPDVPDERAQREPADVRVAPLHPPPAGRGRSGGTAELTDPGAPRPVPPVRDLAGKARGPAAALGIGVLVVAAALGAVFVIGGDGEPEAAPEPRPAPTSRATTSGGTGGAAPPAPTSAPTTTPSARAPGAAASGAVTYQVVEDGPGYYEGSFVLTNDTGRPLPTWRLSFLLPGSDVRNVWGGRLVRGGERTVIANVPGAAAVPPMGTVTIRFGAAGEPARPAGCLVNGTGCGL